MGSAFEYQHWKGDRDPKYIAFVPRKSRIPSPGSPNVFNRILHRVDWQRQQNAEFLTLTPFQSESTHTAPDYDEAEITVTASPSTRRKCTSSRGPTRTPKPSDLQVAATAMSFWGMRTPLPVNSA